MTKTLHDYPYQKEGVRLLHRFKGRALLADQMSLGKSRQSLRYAFKYVKGVVIVVCPAHLKENWRREALKHSGLRGFILDHRIPHLGNSLRRQGRLFIINYDILGLANPPDSSNEPTWTDVLKTLNPELIIVDEAQKIRDHRTKQTRAVHALCQTVPKVIALTATPLMNRPIELWSILNLIRPDLYPSRFGYALRYTAPKRTRWGWDFRGASNLGELNRLLKKKLMIRRRKEDVLDQLPKKIHMILPFKLSPKDFAEYEEARLNFAGWLSKTNRIIAEKKALLRLGNQHSRQQRWRASRVIRALKAEKLVQIGYLKRLAAELKLGQVILWIQDFLQNSDEKLIVFGIHRKILHTLYNRFKSKATLVDGKVLSGKRQAAFDKFNNSKQCRLLFGNVDAAGAGWNSFHPNHFFVESPWTPGQIDQASGRGHGLFRGGGKTARYWYAVAANTIEEMLIGYIQKKRKIIDQTLDGKEIADFDILKHLEEALLTLPKDRHEQKRKKKASSY